VILPFAEMSLLLFAGRAFAAVVVVVGSRSGDGPVYRKEGRAEEGGWREEKRYG